jgi:hypothetical protein
MPYLKYTLLVIFALGSLLKVSAHAPAGDSTAASRSTKKPRFEIQVNGIYATLETNLRFESSAGILGVKINFEDNLGMDKHRILPMFNARFNIKNRHNIFAMYYGLPRDAYYVTKRDIEFRVPTSIPMYTALVICTIFSTMIGQDSDFLPISTFLRLPRGSVPMLNS